jgi:hypothetical protein
LIISSVGTIIIFNQPKIEITFNECHNEINYDHSKERYLISKIADMQGLVESVKLDYLFNKCNYPIEVQNYVINFSNSGITKKMLDLQRPECARFLIMIRDYSQMTYIMGEELDNLYTPKEVCNKTSVNKIIYKYSYNNKSISIPKYKINKEWLQQRLRNGFCECVTKSKPTQLEQNSCLQKCKYNGSELELHSCWANCYSYLGECSKYKCFDKYEVSIK